MNSTIRTREKGRESPAPGAALLRWALRATLALTIVAELWTGELLPAAEALLALALCSLAASRLPHIEGVPSPVVVETILLFIAIGNCTLGVALHLYQRLLYYDKFLHLVNPAVLAYCCVLLLTVVHRRRDGAPTLPTPVLILAAVMLVLGVTAIWELLEFASDQLFHTTTQGTPWMSPLDDTMWDMLLGLGGALLGSWAATFSTSARGLSWSHRSRRHGRARLLDPRSV